MNIIANLPGGTLQLYRDFCSQSGNLTARFASGCQCLCLSSSPIS